MLDLSHQALFTFSQTNKYDAEHPIITDQVFGAQLKHLSNKKKINSLKHRIKKLTNRVHGQSGFKTLNLDLKKNDTIVGSITHELFNVFSWNKVHTTLQASWKEYFHMLYELVVHDYDGDHASNVVIARAVVKYHDILLVPDHIDKGDPMYPMISSLSHLFSQLKAEQLSVYTLLQKTEEKLREVQIQNTEVQNIIISLKRQRKDLEDDNAKYMHIMRWSAE